MIKLRTYGDAAVHAANRRRPGKPRRYVDPFDIRPGDKVVLVCRVTSERQRATLIDQLDDLRKAVEEAGGEVVAIITHVGPGSQPDWLIRVARIAMRHGAIILARDLSRLIRHPDFHAANDPLRPRDEDLRAMRACLDRFGPVTVMTLLAPTATDDEVRTHRTKQKSGRPKKASRKPNHRQAAAIEKLDDARRLGFRSVRQVATFCKRSASTVQGWIKQWEIRKQRPWSDDFVAVGVRSFSDSMNVIRHKTSNSTASSALPRSKKSKSKIIVRFIRTRA